MLDGLIRIIARTRVKEAMTACALLTVVGVTLVMEQAGLSASLGAFIAGVLLADSDYRHEIQADIAPFEGLLLGLFFTAIGMSLNLRLVVDSPNLVLAIVVGLLAIKSAVLFLLGRRAGLEAGPSRRLALAIAQGGEFAFVLFTTGAAAGVLEQPVADLLSVAVTLSMAATPLLLLVDEMLAPRAAVIRAFDAMPENDGHVVIAGFGRVGQIVARILLAKKIPFTALDSHPQHVDAVRKFGARAFYGDASRPEILDAAQTGKARAFVLAIDNVEASLRTAEMVKQRYPHVPIYARSRHRRHTHQLMDLGIQVIRRETFCPRSTSPARCCAVSASRSATCASPSTLLWRRTASVSTRTTSTTPIWRSYRSAPRATPRSSRASSPRTPPSKPRPGRRRRAPELHRLARAYVPPGASVRSM